MSRDIDAKVARMMGYQPWVDGEKVSILLDDDDCPHYSTDVAAAMQLLDQIYAQGWGIELQRWRGGPEPQDQWEATFEDQQTYTAAASTLPMAICLAALKAVK